MKKILFTLLGVLFLFFHLTSCIHSQNTNKANCDTNNVDSIIGAYVDFEILTPYNVLCHDFYDAFSDVKYIVLKDKSQIEEMIGLLDSLKQISMNDYIDTRIKLYIYERNAIKPVCIGRNTILYNNIFYSNNPEFIESFNKIINKGLHIEGFSESLDLDKPTFPGGIDSLYKSFGDYWTDLKDKCLIKDTLHLLVEFNIDKEGSGVDFILRNRNKRNSIDTLLMKSCVGKEIESIITRKLKWSSSKWRQPKVRTYIPITLYPDN